ncbi:MAG TPA: hypothetical protein VJZ92_03230 [Thermodesulfobacteriota bacterium]|nr:hypothetical protein [Thermodesulfobacteriota bacterium]
MIIEKTWSANSMPQSGGEGDELINMAGRWNIGIEVSIVKPYTYLQGPVERRITGAEIQDNRNTSL